MDQFDNNLLGTFGTNLVSDYFTARKVGNSSFNVSEKTCKSFENSFNISKHSISLFGGKTTDNSITVQHLRSFKTNLTGHRTTFM